MGIISAKGTPDMVIDIFIVANPPRKIKSGDSEGGNRGFNAIGEKQRGNCAQTVDKFGYNIVKDCG